MKIALIVPSLLNKAPVLVARDLAAGFLKQGHEVHVFYFDESNEIEFPCPSRRISPFSLNKIRGFDVIHSHMIRPDFFAVMHRLLGIKSASYVTTIHNIVEEDLANTYGRVTSFIWSKIWRFLWHFFNARVVLTNQARHYYDLTQPRDRFTVIQNGRSLHINGQIESQDQDLICRLRNNYKLVGSCAVVSHRKGLEQMVRTLPFLPDVAFILIGEGPALQELKDEAIALGVSERFVSLGYRSNARDYLPLFDAYVMPSRSEGLPLALLEAASAGVAIACSDIEQFKDVFEEDEAVFFPLDFTEKMAQAIKHTLENSMTYGRSAKNKFQTCFTQEIMVDRYLSLYNKLLSK